MRRSALFALSIVLAGFPPVVGAQVEHVTNPLGDFTLPASPDVMNARIREAATLYRRHAPIPRYVQYDLAEPRDAGEYSELHGYGVVLLSVLTQTPAEIPPRRLYARIGASTVPLVLYASGSTSEQADPNVKLVFGSNRWEGLYLLPMYLVVGRAQLIMDFARNREGFLVAKLGDDASGNDAAPSAESTAPAELPPAVAINKFLAREYPGFDSSRVEPSRP